LGSGFIPVAVAQQNGVLPVDGPLSVARCRWPTALLAGGTPMPKNMPAADERLAAIDAYVRRVHGAQDQLIQTLHVAQDVYGYLSDEVLLYVARALRLPPSLVYGVATFYHLFHFEPPGEHVATICTGTACFVKGADQITAEVTLAFGTPLGQTTADRRLTLSTARCLGSCGLAPVVVLDGQVHGHMSPDSTMSALRDALGANALEEVG
jgi:bidirectional [NiFe] hydrogenase diaphorase subunit